ncbi:MAG: hypothetical protein EBX39_04840 [Actinobacteria bacterium]|nr:hypothetical protein [Actinomycetota bacterium]
MGVTAEQDVAVSQEGVEEAPDALLAEAGYDTANVRTVRVVVKVPVPQATQQIEVVAPALVEEGAEAKVA